MLSPCSHYAFSLYFSSEKAAFIFEMSLFQPFQRGIQCVSWGKPELLEIVVFSLPRCQQGFWVRMCRSCPSGPLLHGVSAAVQWPGLSPMHGS